MLLGLATASCGTTRLGYRGPVGGVLTPPTTGVTATTTPTTAPECDDATARYPSLDPLPARTPRRTGFMRRPSATS